VVVVDLEVVLVELEVELEVVFVDVVLDELVVDALALRTYPSEAVKFKLGESGNSLHRTPFWPHSKSYK
jgi:hypothetical protein